MDRFEIVKIINEYAFNNNIKPIVEYLNDVFAKVDYKKELDLIFLSIAATRLYGFLTYLTNEEKNLFFNNDYFRSNLYRGIKLPYYNYEQLSFLYEIDLNNKIFFSAPTSFGKTSIVIEYILNNTKFLNNIVFIVPTNSLLEELFDKFALYNSNLSLNYNVATQPVSSLVDRNVLFLTPERFLAVTECLNLNNFDLIIMDETYKIVGSQNQSIYDFINHRSLRFRKVADLIAKSNTKVIFLSPFTYSLSKSMTDFLFKHNIKKIDRELEYVKRVIIKLADSNDVETYFGTRIKGYRQSLNLTQKTKLILNELRFSSSIVYVSNYSEAYKIASSIDFSCLNKEKDIRYISFLKHIKANFLIDDSENWAVYEALQKGIGIYIAPLPRYIKKEIIRLFEEKVLTVLIVTSAFTEGVNTCASDLIFTSLVNGPNKNKLSDIDVLNVSGRAGRFAKNTVGRIFCIKEDIYTRVLELQNKNNIMLENYNYQMSSKLIDYEIEMMDSEYLSDNQKELLRSQQSEAKELGLNKNDLNISLNVSNCWKLILYKHFLKFDEKTVKKTKYIIENIYKKENSERISSLDYIFKDLANAFETTNINVFPQENYEIRPFDKSGEFTWGRLYKIYVSEYPKQIIINNINFITAKFKEILNNNTYIKKKNVEELFEQQGAKWILKYYKNDLTINMNAFYSETFKFISNIIQYKIPFYLAFYVSIFKLFTKKNKQFNILHSEFDINKLINIFEDNDIDNEYSKLIDYGLPINTVKKISNIGISFDDLKEGKIESENIDDYEKIIICDVAKLL